MSGRSFTSILLLCFFLSFSPLFVLSQPWVASFLTASSRSLVSTYFDSSHSRFPEDNSTAQVECDHMTIEFNPQPSPEKYSDVFGLPQQIHLLGYVHDEHGQAVLAYINTTEAQKFVLSVNEYPHVTVSDSAADPYGAVYSNDLWARFEAAGIISTVRDSFGKPYDFRIGASSIHHSIRNEWEGALPAFNSTTSSAQYAATLGYVTKFQERPVLDSVVCVDTAWDRATDTCQTVAAIALIKAGVTPGK